MTWKVRRSKQRGSERVAYICISTDERTFHLGIDRSAVCRKTWGFANTLQKHRRRDWTNKLTAGRSAAAKTPSWRLWLTITVSLPAFANGWVFSYAYGRLDRHKTRQQGNSRIFLGSIPINYILKVSIERNVSQHEWSWAVLRLKHQLLLLTSDEEQKPALYACPV